MTADRASLLRSLLVATGAAVALLLTPARAPAQTCERLCSNGVDCCDGRVIPILECIEPDPENGEYTAIWGYDNTNDSTVDIPPEFDPNPQLANNVFFAGLLFQGQPLVFLPGRHEAVFSTTALEFQDWPWLLDGSFVTATSDSMTCPTLFSLNERVRELEQTTLDLQTAVETLEDRLTGLIDPSADADEDAVVNRDDVCPNTAEGTPVDARGCSLDQFCGAISLGAKKGEKTCQTADWDQDGAADCAPSDGSCQVL